MTRFQTCSISRRCQQLCQSIPEAVNVVAVTKTVAVSTMREAYGAGIRDFGESRVQEAIAKKAELSDLPDIRWHLIGHLQRNKAKKAMQQFDWIHSLDSLRLATALNEAAFEVERSPNLCLQVKILPDPNKFGWKPEELLADLEYLDSLEHLSIIGLMAIPPMGLSKADILDYFNQVRELSLRINELPLKRIQIRELSMGMSNDYAIAIQAGSTIIRPGRILFGERLQSCNPV